MSVLLRTSLAASLLLFGAFVPSSGQNPQPPKLTPKLEPIAETRLLMEGLAHANFRGLERNLLKDPIDDQAWTFARGQALLIAETANLLMLRPPQTPASQPIWFGHAMDLRSQAMSLGQVLSKKDLARSKAGMQQLANSCNRCHTGFRVNVDIVPFQQPEPPPIRKVSSDL
jgi:hypothetical protein